jgi:hypothetical protein
MATIEEESVEVRRVREYCLRLRVADEKPQQRRRLQSPPLIFYLLVQKD